MKYIAAYCLLVVGGNATPSVADVSKVIEAAGGEVDQDMLAPLVAEMADKDINELLAAGETKLASCSGGSGGGEAAAGGAAEAAPEAKEEEEEIDFSGGMDMFGGGGDGGDY